jgi:hypothetical protein
MTVRKRPFMEVFARWKEIVGALVALVGFGMAAQACVSGLARAAAVAQVRAEAQAVAARTSVVESSMNDLKVDLRIIREQLFEIAKTTGARTVVDPARRTP